MQTTKPTMRRKADLTLFAVAIIWGTGFIAQGIAGQHHVAYLYNGASFILAALFLLPFIRRGRKIPQAQGIWMLVAGVVLFTATTLILGLEAVFAAVAAWLILRQELFPVQVAGCVIIFASVTLSQLKGLKKLRGTPFAVCPASSMIGYFFFRTGSPVFISTTV